MNNLGIHVFEAQKNVAMALPDVQDTDIQNIKYTGIFIKLMAK